MYLNTYYKCCKIFSFGFSVIVVLWFYYRILQTKVSNKFCFRQFFHQIIPNTITPNTNFHNFFFVKFFCKTITPLRAELNCQMFTNYFILLKRQFVFLFPWRLGMFSAYLNSEYQTIDSYPLYSIKLAVCLLVFFAISVRSQWLQVFFFSRKLNS